MVSLDEYDSFITSIEMRIQLVTLDELHVLLCNCETTILKRKTRSISAVATKPFHAYAATSGSSRPNFKGRRSHGWFHSNCGSHFHSCNHHFIGTNNSSGRGLLPMPSSSFSGNTSNGNNFIGFLYNSSGFSTDHSMTCQICECKGYSALTCRQRLNLFYRCLDLETWRVSLQGMLFFMRTTSLLLSLLPPHHFFHPSLLNFLLSLLFHNLLLQLGRYVLLYLQSLILPTHHS